jgi:N-acetylneuraminic acid mutarotase
MDNRIRDLRFVVIAVLLCAAAAGLTSSGTLLALSQHEGSGMAQRTLTFEERVSYQHAIEDVYWRHRIWPKERSDSKPSLDVVISQTQIEKKVRAYLRNSQALADYWQRPLTTEQLQAEMDRMAQNTRQPEVLQELFEALGNDPFVIAECLARPLLAERLLEHPEFERVKQQSRTFGRAVAGAGADYTLPQISDTSVGCIGDTWTPTNLTGAPDGRVSHTAVWTGSEMIVWGGDPCFFSCDVNTGGRYNPSTDSWTATSTTNAPDGRHSHTAVWTGTEMIVWGGWHFAFYNTGGKYNPVTDSWTATSTTNAPNARLRHTAVWTGSEMIIWGGDGENSLLLNTGGKYNPLTDSWTATSTSNVPEARNLHTAVWTDSEMIVWGGRDENFLALNTGGKYNPITDSWTATSTTNAPDARSGHTAIWTGSNMIVWGGGDGTSNFDNGGRYEPGTDSWTGTSTTNAPDARGGHTAIWTGSNMIVWGGGNDTSALNSGGRYYPDLDRWAATSIANAPDARGFHTAVWTGSEMVVWGGIGSVLPPMNTGGRYCVPSGSPRRPRPTPHPRPTPP